MPDILDDLLADLAREAGGSVPVPDPGAVRRRGARRTTRRRLTASVLALVLVGAVVGTAEAVIVPRNASAPIGAGTSSAARHSALPSPGAPSASMSPPPPSGAGSPSESGVLTSTPSNSDGIAAQFDALVGQWKPATGIGRYLIVYPDGVLGIGQAGGLGQPLCGGQVHALSGGVYPITVACSDYGTSGLSLSVDAGTGALTLNEAATATSSAYHLHWVRAQSSSAVADSGADILPPGMSGTWALSNNPAYETFTIASNGTVTWSRQNQVSGSTHGTATMERLADDTFRVHTSTGTPAYNGFWQFAYLEDGTLQVIGGYGPDEFDRVAANS